MAIFQNNMVLYTGSSVSVVHRHKVLNYGQCYKLFVIYGTITGTQVHNFSKVPYQTEPATTGCNSLYIYCKIAMFLWFRKSFVQPLTLQPCIFAYHCQRWKQYSSTMLLLCQLERVLGHELDLWIRPKLKWAFANIYFW